jgi:hypothetical protein
MHMSRSSRTRHGSRTLSLFEHLETRRLLSKGAPTFGRLDLIPSKPVELAPETIDPATGLSRPNRVLDPADIVWVNRANTTTGGTGDTDGFGARYGTSAPLCRAVVDAVIVAYERMIGSFDYPSAGQTYSLTLNSSGTGFGASAGLGSVLGGKPKSGTINMGGGNTDADPNNTNGWFMDPTPFDSSEFQGAIQNAFAGDASGGGAIGVGDFYTVVCAEMTHCMGEFPSSLTNWNSLNTNTGVADTTAGPGFYYAFRGPSIKHLMTSDNGGFQDFGASVHSAEPVRSLVFAGDTYNATNDQGNAIYEFGRRYMVNQAFSLMFKDTYNYASVNPAQFSTGTMYSIRNSTTNAITVRGTSGVDTISITRTGSTISVSVDPQADVAGSGALPGAGDLPAWVTNYNISEVSSISIDAGASNDAITIGADVGVPISVQGGSGSNSLTVQGSAANEAITVNPSTIVTSAETITVAGGITSLTVDGGGGTDTINALDNLNGTTFTTVVNSAGNDVVNVNTDAGGTATVQFNTSMQLGALTIASGGLANMAANGNNLLQATGLAISGNGTLDMFDNDLMVTPGVVGTIQSLINSARNGGAWNGAGITSTSARTNGSNNTTLGVMTGSEYQSVNGATFDGAAVAANAAVVKYTYYGDTDFNGLVNFDDYVRTDSGFNNHRTGWTNGDFNGDGQVNFDDYVLIDLGFNTQSGTL